MKTENELIAEFMGFLRTPQRDTIWKIYWHPKKDIELKTIEMAFDRSWEWLMPVVEKITPIARGENENKSLDVAWGDISGPLVRGDINGVYAYVVNFINRYNSQNPKP